MQNENSNKVFHITFSNLLPEICAKYEYYLTPARQRLLLKLIPYPTISMVSGLIYYIVEVGLLGDSEVYPATNVTYNSTTSLFGILSMTFVVGISLGLMEEVFFKNRFKNRPFFIKILTKTSLYVFLLVVLLIGFSFVLNSINAGAPIYSGQVSATVLSFFLSFTFFSVIIYGGVMIGVSLFYTEIVDYLGLDVVKSFFTGKYSKSAIEDRVFMFLDMKGSTAIAERLGHGKHYELINDYYSDMTQAIIQTMGSIYQYVGDEIVIFWNLEDGLSQQNCLRCFFLIKQAIADKRAYYETNYGLVPSFKAALHLGEVTRGQVGLIKRDLLFTGDVLNTTSRIQGLCNELNSELLITSKIKDAVGQSDFHFLDKGSYGLKGKGNKVSLYQVSLTS